MAGMGPILVVDDDDSILDFGQMSLEGEGYEVVSAMKGREALETVDGVVPALILLVTPRDRTPEGFQRRP